MNIQNIEEDASLYSFFIQNNHSSGFRHLQFSGLCSDYIEGSWSILHYKSFKKGWPCHQPASLTSFHRFVVLFDGDLGAVWVQYVMVNDHSRYPWFGYILHRFSCEILERQKSVFPSFLCPKFNYMVQFPGTLNPMWESPLLGLRSKVGLRDPDSSLQICKI